MSRSFKEKKKPSIVKPPLLVCCSQFCSLRITDTNRKIFPYIKSKTDLNGRKIKNQLF